MSPSDEPIPTAGPGDEDDHGLDRVTALLAQRAVTGLDEDEVGQLQTALAGRIAEGAAPDELEDFERLAAAAALAVMAADPEEVPELPAALRERLMADAVRVAHGRPVRSAAAAGPVRRDPARAEAFMTDVESRPPATPPADEASAEASRAPGVAAPAPAAAPTTATPAPVPAPAPRPADDRPGLIGTLLPWMGWAAAAAVLAFVVLPQPPAEPPLTAERLTTTAPDALSVPMAGVPGVAEGVRGVVAWSDERQQGVLRVTGLPANDPGEVQYQLWLFDRGREDRAEQFPAVDGGVFDVPPGTDAIEIPIDAKLTVFEPYLFAITTEPPGGVVKHDPELDPDRFRIVATAAVEG